MLAPAAGSAEPPAAVAGAAAGKGSGWPVVSTKAAWAPDRDVPSTTKAYRQVATQRQQQLFLGGFTWHVCAVAAGTVLALSMC